VHHPCHEEMDSFHQIMTVVYGQIYIIECMTFYVVAWNLKNLQLFALSAMMRWTSIQNIVSWHCNKN
jgi:hypothetical protein